MLVSAHDGAVDLDEPVDVAGRVCLGLDLLENLGEYAAQRVTAEAGVDSAPRPVAFGEVTPWRPSADLVDHLVDDLPVIRPWPSSYGPGYERGE